MTPEEIKRLRKRLKETRVQFARHFGHGDHHLSPRTILSWELEVDHPDHRTPSAAALAILQRLQRKAFGQEEAE